MNARIRTALFALTLATSTLAVRDANAQCATGDCPPCTMCRVPPASGSNPGVPTMSGLFDQVAAGPSVYGTLGWDFGTAAARTIGEGSGWCGGTGPRSTVPVHFPCILLKAIYLTESSWTQFCASNLTVIAFDCGYGIAQVTSGMRPGDTSLFDPNLVASSPAYNVSVGASILADKWRATPCVGGNSLDVIEDWYFAVWGYNGLTFGNNPNNPMYSATRPEFRTPGIASAQVRGNYPYQELVWGYAHYPLTAQHYTGIGLAYPNRSEICASCGVQTANISEPVGAHMTTCPSSGPPPDAGVHDASMADVPTAMDVSDVAVASDASGGADVQDAGSAMDARGSGAENSTISAGCGCAVPGRGGARSVVVPVLWVIAAMLIARQTTRGSSRA
jgi:hypothetical protein